MINRYLYKQFTWVDLESPTADEVREVMTMYTIDPILAEDLLVPNLKPKVEIFDDYIYLVLHFPTLKKVNGKHMQALQEVDFVVGRNVLLTARYDAVDPLHKFSKIFETNSILDKSDLSKHGGTVFYFMMKHIYESMNNELEGVADRLKAIEEHIFSNHEKEMVTELSQVSRLLLDFKHAITHHKDILTVFERFSGTLFGEDFTSYARALLSEYTKVADTVRNLSELHTELRLTNDSLLSSARSETMKNFTILAFMTFPLSLLVTILAFPSPTNPFVHANYSFTVMVGIVIVGAAAMYYIFKQRRWL